MFPCGEGLGEAGWVGIRLPEPVSGRVPCGAEGRVGMGGEVTGWLVSWWLDAEGSGSSHPKNRGSPIAGHTLLTFPGLGDTLDAGCSCEVFASPEEIRTLITLS